MSFSLVLPDNLSRLTYPRRMSFEAFEALCAANPELVIEREADGTLTIMSPVSFTSGDREANFIADLKLYERRVGGKALSSSTGFRLPDSSVRSPDACYVSEDKLSGFTPEDLRRFPAIVPDFVVEVVSPSDELAEVEKKMREVWIANGVQLAWLVDVDTQRLWIYRADRSVELISPLDRTLTGEDILPDFEFDLNVLR